MVDLYLVLIFGKFDKGRLLVSTLGAAFPGEVDTRIMLHLHADFLDSQFDMEAFLFSNEFVHL